MKISNGALHTALRGIMGYVKNADEIEKTIIGFGLAAAAASAAVMWVPAAGEAALVLLMVGFTYGMYIRLAHLCEIKISKNILKTLSSMVISNIVSNLSVLLVTLAILAFIPGVGNAGAALIGALAGFACQYIAGILFVKMITDVFKCSKDPSMMSEKELKDILSDIQSKEDIKKDFNDARNAYREVKDDKSFNPNDYKSVDPDKDI